MNSHASWLQPCLPASSVRAWPLQRLPVHCTSPCLCLLACLCSSRHTLARPSRCPHRPFGCPHTVRLPPLQTSMTPGSPASPAPRRTPASGPTAARSGTSTSPSFRWGIMQGTRGPPCQCICRRACLCMRRSCTRGLVGAPAPACCIRPQVATAVRPSLEPNPCTFEERAMHDQLLSGWVAMYPHICLSRLQAGAPCRACRPTQLCWTACVRCSRSGMQPP